MIPGLAARLEAWLSGLASRAGVVESDGDGFWSGVLRRRQSRPCLRAVRRADPGRRHHRLRLAGLQRRPPRRRLQLRDRLSRRPLFPDARRPQGDPAAGPARNRPPGRDGRGHGGRRPGDARQLRHPVPEPHRQQPAELPGQPDQEPRGHRLGQRRARRNPRRSSRGRLRSHRRGAGSRPPTAVSTFRCSAWRRNSSTTSAGSTPPATAR